MIVSEHHSTVFWQSRLFYSINSIGDFSTGRMLSHSPSWIIKRKHQQLLEISCSLTILSCLLKKVKYRVQITAFEAIWAAKSEHEAESTLKAVHLICSVTLKITESFLRLLTNFSVMLIPRNLKLFSAPLMYGDAVSLPPFFLKPIISPWFCWRWAVDRSLCSSL